MAYNDSRNPLRALQDKVGSEIVVRLKDGTEYVGNLKKFDSFMNIIINSAEKRASPVEDVSEESESEVYKEIFIRGNNVLFILPN